MLSLPSVLRIALLAPELKVLAVLSPSIVVSLFDLKIRGFGSWILGE